MACQTTQLSLAAEKAAALAEIGRLVPHIPRIVPVGLRVGHGRLTVAVAAKPVDLENLVKQLKDQMAQSHFNGIAKNATILVVDDDESIRSLLHQELSDAGYLVDEAGNGNEPEELRLVTGKLLELVARDVGKEHSHLLALLGRRQPRAGFVAGYWVRRKRRFMDRPPAGRTRRR